jgi:hypothetical protein
VANEVIRTPDIRSAIKRGFQQGARIVQNYAVLNASGRVLKRASGNLARSIYTKVTKTRYGAVLRVGTKLYYGLFWEKGFKHVGRAKRTRERGQGKFMAPRPWLRPAARQALPEISNLIKLEVDRELKAVSGKITIELKLT